MSGKSETCVICNKPKNNLNKTNWNRYLAACTISSLKKEKYVRNDKIADIKLYFSCKRTSIENLTENTDSAIVTTGKYKY